MRVLHLAGVISCELVHCLAATEDQKLFTKLMTHGLLKYLWKRFRCMFLVDLLHQVFAIAVISYWILCASRVETPDILRRALWGIVAAQGLAECFTFVWTCVICYQELGRQKLLVWINRVLYRAVIGMCTMALAIETGERFEPTENSSVWLSLNGLLHWIMLLFEIRAFRWTGKRLLPIMKSVIPIAGMVVIMLFISLGFMHAFWAMNREAIDDISVFNIVVLLFTGEHFISDEDFEAMGQQEREMVIFLSMGGMFIFLTCTINVFIAVLSDCYDQEQERMVCTFLKERARVCSGYFLRPKLHVQGFFKNEDNELRKRCWVVLAFVLLVIYFTLLYMSSEAGLTAWLAAIYLAIAVISVQCILRDGLTSGWKKKHLWICHESGVDEEMFLAPDERDMEESHGRITRVKRYIRDQTQYLGSQFKAVSRNVRESYMRLNYMLDKQSRTLAHIEEQVRDFTPPAAPADLDVPTPMFGPRRSHSPPPSTAGADAHKPPRLPLASRSSPRSLSGSDQPALLGILSAAQKESPQEAAPEVIQASKACSGCLRHQEIRSLRQDVLEVQGSVKELWEKVEEQRESQQRLETVCQDISETLHEVVELAQSAQQRRQKKSLAALPRSDNKVVEQRCVDIGQLPPLRPQPVRGHGETRSPGDDKERAQRQSAEEET